MTQAAPRRLREGASGLLAMVSLIQLGSLSTGCSHNPSMSLHCPISKSACISLDCLFPHGCLFFFLPDSLAVFL
ncbi:hypothetical protein FKM82_021284 [Ascaphus truei]